MEADGEQVRLPVGDTVRVVVGKQVTLPLGVVELLKVGNMRPVWEGLWLNVAEKVPVHVCDLIAGAFPCVNTPKWGKPPGWVSGELSMYQF